LSEEALEKTKLDKDIVRLLMLAWNLKSLKKA
jgi:hypothetical protein